MLASYSDRDHTESLKFRRQMFVRRFARMVHFQLKSRLDKPTYFTVNYVVNSLKIYKKTFRTMR